MEIKKEVAIAPYTSWLIGGPAEYLVFPETVEDVAEALQIARKRQLPLFPLGHGTNVLAPDEGVRGMVLCFRRMVGVEVVEDSEVFRLSVLSGTPKSMVLRFFLREELSPAQLFAGIPGNVGGGVVMNAGIAEQVRPSEFSEVVDRVDVMDWTGKLRSFSHDELQWGYRECGGWQPGVIVRVGLRWTKQKQPKIAQKVKLLNKNRLEKQPLDQPSCGSVFRNPPGESAGRLIEAVQLKGHRIGNAMFSRKHANFIVNLGEGRASDIKQLIQLAQKKVLDTFGVQLRREVVFLEETSHKLPG